MVRFPFAPLPGAPNLVCAGLGTVALVALPLGLLGCADASLAELGRAACADGDDNDGDGSVDCDDPDCDDTGTCESRPATCINGVDDDGDGAIDCADASCHAESPCLATETPCVPSDPASCPFGQGCYARADGGTECRGAGPAVAREPCDLDTLESLREGDGHPCAAGLGCRVPPGARRGLCTRWCERDADCGFGALCLRAPGVPPDGPGLCQVGCDPGTPGEDGDPNADCPEGYLCLAGQAWGVPGAAGGYRHECVSGEAFSPGTIDDPTVPCEDPTGGDPPPPADRCDPRRLCWGTVRSALRCLPLCALGGRSCAEGADCTPPDPASDTGLVPPVGHDGRALGVCAPR